MIISEVLSINEKMTNQNNSHHMISNHMAAAYEGVKILVSMESKSF